MGKSSVVVVLFILIKLRYLFLYLRGDAANIKTIKRVFFYLYSYIFPLYDAQVICQRELRTASNVTPSSQSHSLKSGYAFARKMPGNALLVLKLPASDAQVAAASDAQVFVESAAK